MVRIHEPVRDLRASQLSVSGLGEPVTLRSLVAGTGMSTMAVYTYFGGMDGVWKALRQEGFIRLAARFATVPTSEDPVQDLTALTVAYLGNALDHPDLYRVMFDANFDLEDLQAADATMEYMVQAAERSRQAGRLRVDTDPLEVPKMPFLRREGLEAVAPARPIVPSKRSPGHPRPLGAVAAALRLNVSEPWPALSAA